MLFIIVFYTYILLQLKYMITLCSNHGRKFHILPLYNLRNEIPSLELKWNISSYDWYVISNYRVFFENLITHKTVLKTKHKCSYYLFNKTTNRILVCVWALIWNCHWTTSATLQNKRKRGPRAILFPTRFSSYYNVWAKPYGTLIQIN